MSKYIIKLAQYHSERLELSSPSVYTRMAPVSFATGNINYPKL